jgi:enoyl-CoA hydratase/carnithine racemase
MVEQPVRCTRLDGIALVTLDNPPLNLVTLELTRRLDRLIAELAADPAVLVVVLTGAGERAFCAGSDIGEFSDMMAPGAVVPKKLGPENDTYNRLANFPKPTIAALNGIAFGGGLELAVCCDLVVAEQGQRVALPEIKLGIFPASGGTIRVTRRVGTGRAKQLMFFGEPITCELAFDWGLVDRLAPRGGALDAAMAMARTLAERPNTGLRMCKQLIDMALDGPVDASVRASLPMADVVFASEDCREGVRAFFAKKAPRFRHR